MSWNIYGLDCRHEIFAKPSQISRTTLIYYFSGWRCSSIHNTWLHVEGFINKHFRIEQIKEGSEV